MPLMLQTHHNNSRPGEKCTEIVRFTMQPNLQQIWKWERMEKKKSWEIPYFCYFIDISLLPYYVPKSKSISNKRNLIRTTHFYGIS